MSASKKTVHTVLDSLPYGPSDDSQRQGPVKGVRLPDGVTNRAMVMDVVAIAWPSLAELILTQLTSMADQIMVGRMAGEAGIQGLSAVGLAGLPKMLLMTMIMAMNVGSTAVVARYRGQQNQEKANQTFTQALILNFVMSIFFMVVGLAFSTQLIGLMSGAAISAATLEQAVTYLDIQLYGLVPLCFTFTISASLRGTGDTRTPMIYNTVANIVNVIFNYMLIYGKFGCPEMGVAGASLATVIGQNAAFFIAVFVVLSKKRYIFLDFKKKFQFDMSIMRNVVAIGLPSMVEQLLMRLGVMIFTRCVSGLGDTLYATHNVCMNIQSMSFMLGQAFGNSTTTLMGQSIGKRRYDMAAGYMRITVSIGALFATALGIFLATCGGFVVSIYNSTPEVIDIGGKILIMVAVTQPIQSTQFIVSGGLRGAGDTKFAAVVTAITVIFIRSVLAILTINYLNWGLWGAWIAVVADQIGRSVLMVWRYRAGHWKRLGIRTDSHPAKA